MSIFFCSLPPSGFYYRDKIVNKIYLNEKLIWVKNGGGDSDDLPYLCFTAEEAGSTISMIKDGSAPTVYLETSPTGKDGSWSDFTVGSTTITLANIGDKVYFRAKQDNARFATEYYTNCNQFVMTGKIAASGNLNTLLKADGSVLDLTGRKYCYASMFYNCTSLTQAPALPATTLADYCYYRMFRDTSLTQAPALPATTLALYCYASMFYNCTSLTQAPALPATTLALYCYSSMFEGCSSLTQASELPATSLVKACYNSMFRGTSLTKAPALPATTLAESCYYQMFRSCTSLTQAPELPATSLAYDCYAGMFSNSGIPSFIVDMTACTSVPSLPSKTLFSSSGKPYTVLVPASLYDEWIQATNWSTIANKIQAV